MLNTILVILILLTIRKSKDNSVKQVSNIKDQQNSDFNIINNKTNTNNVIVSKEVIVKHKQVILILLTIIQTNIIF